MTVRIPLQYHKYGPFDVPSKKNWVIVGTGPTANLVKRFTADNEDVGVVSLNAQLSGIPYSTVHMVGHYEYYMQCVHDLDKPEVMFFANPIHVGFRCLPVMAINMLDLKFYAQKMGERLRFFEKEPDLSKFDESPNKLYCHDSIGSTALHLLSRNNIKEVFYCGMDGQEMSARLGRSKMFEDAYRIRAVNAGLDWIQPDRFDFELAAFRSFGKQLGINLTNLADIYQKDLVAA